LRVLASAADPASAAGEVQGYSKSVATIAQLFARAGGGVISQLTPLVTVFDDSVAGTYSNIRGNQLATRSPIDNTKARIVNLSSKTGTVNAGATGATANGATIGGGDDNSATGTNSCVPGGQGGTASGFGALACGSLCLASGTVAIAGGNQCTASADYAVALGSQNLSSAPQACTIGAGCTSSGAGAFALGQACSAQADNAFAMGLSCVSSAVNAHSRGLLAKASRVQDTFAAGAFDDVTAGQAQTTHLVYRGTTPGAAATESVVLLSSTGGTQIGPVLEDSKAYAFVITCVIGGTQAGPTQISQTIIIKFTAQRIAGTSVITGSGVGEQFGSVGGATWTLAPTVGAGPDRLILTFTTGLVATACKVVARIEMTEVAAF